MNDENVEPSAVSRLLETPQRSLNRCAGRSRLPSGRILASPSKTLKLDLISLGRTHRVPYLSAQTATKWNSFLNSYFPSNKILFRFRKTLIVAIYLFCFHLLCVVDNSERENEKESITRYLGKFLHIFVRDKKV